MTTSENTADAFVVGCLRGIGCSQYSNIFCENEIDFAAFKDLSREELTLLLPGKVGPQKKIFGEIQRIKALEEVRSQNVRRSTEAVPITNQLKAADFVTAKSVPRLNAVPVEANSLKKPDLPTAVSVPSVTGPGSLRKPDVPTTASVPVASGPGSLRKPAALSAAIPASEQKTDVSKFGITLPTPKQFAANIAIGTVTKVVIDEYIYPALPGAIKPASSKAAAAAANKPAADKPAADTPAADKPAAGTPANQGKSEAPATDAKADASSTDAKADASATEADATTITGNQPSNIEASAFQEGSGSAVNARMSPGDTTTSAADSDISADTAEASNPFQEMYGGPENHPDYSMQSDETLFTEDNFAADAENVEIPDAYGEYEQDFPGDEFYDTIEVPVDFSLDAPLDVPLDVPVDVPLDVVDGEAVNSVVDGVINAIFGL